MNLLAHAHLGLNHGPTVNTVNVLWDFICRDYLTSDDATILAGRSLHQEIDRLADQSAFFFETSKQLSPQRRRAARLLIDLFSDYFLAQHWDRFCEQPLDDFLERLVPSLQEEARHMSPRAKLIAQRIEEHNWFQEYQTIDGIGLVLRRISSRSSPRVQNLLGGAEEELWQKEAQLTDGFLSFYTELYHSVAVEPLRSEA